MRRATVVPVVVLALAAGGGIVWAANGPDRPRYRTATVATGDVEQLLTQTGVVSVLSQEKSSFPVAGIVNSVAVHVGDIVQAGQVLATIDKAPLTAAVTAAEATLATAKATLESDAATTTSTTASTTTSTTAAATTSTGSAVGATASTTTGTVSLMAYLTAGPSPRPAPTGSGTPSAATTGSVDADLARVQADTVVVTAALAAADAACDAATPSPSASPSASPTPSAMPSASSAVGATSSPGATGGPVGPPGSGTGRPAVPSVPGATVTASCRTALDGVRLAQATLASDEAAALRDLQAAQATTGTGGTGTGGTGTGGTGTGGTSTGGTGTGGTGTGGTGPGGTGSGGTGSGGTGSGGTKGTGSGGSGAGAGSGTAGASGTGSAGGSSGSTAGRGTTGLSQAARLTLDHDAVAAATTALATAKSDLASATLRSTLHGTVAAMPFLAGQSESTTDTITVIGSGPVRVTLNVPYAAVASVKVGQAATVVADGVTTSVPGTVASIGLLPATSSSQSATAYPVTVLVAQPRGGFVDGGAASVSIAVKAAKAAVLVPNSALSTGAVFVMTGGQAVRVPVQTGVVGPLMTEVTSGVTPGQQVVLADMSASLPANSTTTGRGAFGGSGGRPFPQGGFQGGNGGPPPG